MGHARAGLVLGDGSGALMTRDEPTPFGQARARQIWAKRGLQNELRHAMTPGEIRYVHDVWDEHYPEGISSWKTAFFAILNGKHEAESFEEQP